MLRDVFDELHTSIFGAGLVGLSLEAKRTVAKFASFRVAYERLPKIPRSG
jgi:hypothetical protein